ncbi:MAG: hypothetical protein COA44_08100 [Arcobacter sp.]|nr:MAG: hypothetical protein COA44_08100 [Arcobacter sp.]
MKKEIKEKLENIIELVNNAMVDPDIDIDYCIPEVDTTLKACDQSGEPYILLTYVVSEYTKPTRKIYLGSTDLLRTAEEVSNKVTTSIIEFKAQIDSVEMG